jgi:hypothetical protein
MLCLYHALAMPCCWRFGLCHSNSIYTWQLYLIHTCHAMPIPHPCHAPTMSLWKQPLKAAAWHMWINISYLPIACGRHAHVWFLLATTWTIRKVNQIATAFWDVFSCSDDDGDSRLYRIIHLYELKLKAAFLMLLCYISIVYSSFDCLWKTTVASFKFWIPIPK